MSIRNRILAVAGSFAVMALMVTALGLVTVHHYNTTIRHFDRAWLNAWRSERLNNLVSKSVMESRGLYLSGDAADSTTFAANLNRDLDDIDRLMSEWRADATPSEVGRLEAMTVQTRAFIALRRELARLGAAGKSEEAEALGASNRPMRIAFQAQLDRLVATTQGELSVARAETETYSKQRAVYFLLTALVMIAVMMGLTMWIMTRFITRPLRELASAIMRTSQGDYETPLVERAAAAGTGSDEVAAVWMALGVLKQRAIEHDRLAQAQRDAERREEMKLREILLD